MKRICFVGFALAAFTSALSFAGKSAPAPAGTIYFQCAVEPAQYNLEDYIYRMNADGSGKALSPLTPDVQSFDGMPAPSMKSYGTPKRPWWIVRRLNPNAPIGIHADLYATKNGIDLIPLLLSTYNFDPVSGLEYNVSYDAPRWCNDGQDSFFTVIMERRLVDASQQQRKLLSMQLLVCRCDIRSEDLESLPADFEPLTEGDPRLRPLVVYDKPASVSGASIHFAHGGEYACSPDGSTVLVTFSLGNTAESLYSIDVSNVTDVPADFATTAEPIFTRGSFINRI